MELAPNSTHTTTTTATATPKLQEAESETPSSHPPPTQLSKSSADHHHHHHQPKPLSFTNGVLKRRHHLHPSSPVVPVPVVYKECQKNHAASIGGHALDGCGEFMPSPSATPTDPSSLRCAACGCHRNFHRREPEESSLPFDFHLHHHHHHPPPPSNTTRARSPNSPSPPPLSSSYYPSAPHMLLALSSGLSAPSDSHQPLNNYNHQVTTGTTTATPNGRKRFRSKFSQEQKEKMLAFSEKLGWKMQKRDEEMVEEFCNEVGVGKGVLKVWMHNNKHNFAKRDPNGDSNNNNNIIINSRSNLNNIHDYRDNSNGSSSSS